MGLPALAESGLTAAIMFLGLCCRPGLLLPHLRPAPVKNAAALRQRRRAI